MDLNKLSLTFVAFMTYIVMAGLLTQIGVVITPMSAYLGISVPDAASMFSYLTGGALVGTFWAMIVYTRFTIKKILRFNYALFLVVIAMLIVLDIRTVSVVSGYLVLLGVCCGTGLSGGAVIISKLYDENQRASAFIATDCAFSAAGFSFPAITSLLISAGVIWVFGYAAVSLIALLLLLSTFFLDFPEQITPNKQTEVVSGNVIASSTHSIFAILTPRVLLVGLALCLYLIAQTTFLTWAPTYLQASFDLSSAQAGKAVSNYWGPSVLGLITAAVIVNKVPVRLMLIIVTLIAIALTFFLSTIESTETFLWLTLGFGFFTTCLFKLSISVGSQQIVNAPPILVTFLLMCGTVGSTVAPLLSSIVVEHVGVKSAMVMTCGGYIGVFIALLACLLLERIQTVNAKQQ